MSAAHFRRPFPPSMMTLWVIASRRFVLARRFLF